MTTRRINAIPFTGITQAQTDQIIENTADILTKQDNIVSTTDLTMNDLSIGNDAITPGSTIQYPLLLQQPYLSGGVPQNGFGVGMKFRYNRGLGGLQPADMGIIDSFLKSGANTGAPYGGFKFSAIDDNTMKDLFQVYHTAPNDDGASTMEVGLNSQGTLKTRYITLNNTDLATTLATKQPLLTNTTNIVNSLTTSLIIQLIDSLTSWPLCG